MEASKVEFIIIHCSDSPQNRGDNAETIHRWHTEAPNHWDGIGYHRVILEDGTVEHGRPLYWVGSHARGYNARSIGICLIGDGIYTHEQFHALRGLIFDLLGLFPNAVVRGHCDLDNKKTCPQFDVIKWWAD